jgi:hypothetical protein
MAKMPGFAKAFRLVHLGHLGPQQTQFASAAEFFNSLLVPLETGLSKYNSFWNYEIR